MYILYTDKQKKQLSCKGLGKLLNDLMTKDDQKTFYEITLPFIKQCALSLPAVKLLIYH